MKYTRFCLFAALLLFGVSHSAAQQVYDTGKPWTYWWWMGSAVNKTDLKSALEDFSKAGIGGVHIIPIYGVKGFEPEFIPFLSEKWLEMVQYTLQQARELKLGVDLTLGTGWPYGGPWIDAQSAAKRLVIREYDFKTTNRISVQVDSIMRNNKLLELFALYAVNDRGESIRLQAQPAEKTIRKRVKTARWKLLCFGIANTNSPVKRAAPGGEGLIVDYFDERAVRQYLHRFDSVFSKTAFPVQPRSYYHDSYEVYKADWTASFVQHFKASRGYDLSGVLPIFADTLNPARPHLVHDLRETLAELLVSGFAEPWTAWCKKNNTVSRYQAHGSPANLLDLYALSDIPETESFGCSNFSIPGLKNDPDYEEQRFGRPSPLMMKFASSPAHLLNKNLVASETATWLANHFKVSLSQIKPQIDELFVSGINHVFYHGTTYSPKNEEYPGWLFYASTNFGPGAHFWEELPLLNAYVETCQRLLQNSSPDNDILLYFPIDDLWTQYPGDLLLLLDVHKYSNWFGKTAFGKAAKTLWDNGFAFDYVSDKQLRQLSVNAAGKISATAQASYSVIVVPPIEFISKNTLKMLDNLAKSGAKIIFMDKLPDGFAGYAAQKGAGVELHDLKNTLFRNPHVKISADLCAELKKQNIRQETLKSKGLDFIRKRNGSETLYFITNLSNRFYEDSISLSTPGRFIELFDPQTLKKGYVETAGPFFLPLAPGKSCFIKILPEKPASDPWYAGIPRDTFYLDAPWTVDFISGDTQNLRANYTLASLQSWTEWGDEHLKSFCGKARYRSAFTLKNPEKDARFNLVFEDIRETAAVKINGVPCGTIWSLPYCLELDANILQEKNTIEITVQNLSANRIRAIDQKQKNWKKFYDINFVDIKYQRFDAAAWNPVPSGLIGKVMLVATTKSP